MLLSYLALTTHWIWVTRRLKHLDNDTSSEETELPGSHGNFGIFLGTVAKSGCHPLADILLYTQGEVKDTKTVTVTDY